MGGVCFVLFVLLLQWSLQLQNQCKPESCPLWGVTTPTMIQPDSLYNNSLLIANSNWPWLGWIQSNFHAHFSLASILQVCGRDCPPKTNDCISHFSQCNTTTDRLFTSKWQRPPVAVAVMTGAKEAVDVTDYGALWARERQRGQPEW